MDSNRLMLWLRFGPCPADAYDSIAPL